VKLVEEVAVPPGVVTEILPVLAPAGTAMVICVALVTLNVAEAPLNATPVAPAKFVPVSITLVPTVPLAGEKLVIVGVGIFTEKDAEELALPLGVVTRRVPEVAPAGTLVRICVSLDTVKTAAVPLKESAVAPVRLVPVIVTLVPANPD
jgi:hypothetical protein